MSSMSAFRTRAWESDAMAGVVEGRDGELMRLKMKSRELKTRKRPVISNPATGVLSTATESCTMCP